MLEAPLSTDIQRMSHITKIVHSNKKVHDLISTAMMHPSVFGDQLCHLYKEPTTCFLLICVTVIQLVCHESLSSIVNKISAADIYIVYISFWLQILCIPLAGQLQ